MYKLTCELFLDNALYIKEIKNFIWENRTELKGKAIYWLGNNIFCCENKIFLASLDRNKDGNFFAKGFVEIVVNEMPKSLSDLEITRFNHNLTDKYIERIIDWLKIPTKVINEVNISNFELFKYTQTLNENSFLFYDYRFFAKSDIDWRGVHIYVENVKNGDMAKIYFDQKLKDDSCFMGKGACDEILPKKEKEVCLKFTKCKDKLYATKCFKKAFLAYSKQNNKQLGVKKFYELKLLAGLQNGTFFDDWRTFTQVVNEFEENSIMIEEENPTEYFLIGNSSRERLPLTRICKVYFKKPEYVTTDNYYDYGEKFGFYELSEKDKIDLKNHLQSLCEIEQINLREKNMTNWQWLIYKYNESMVRVGENSHIYWTDRNVLLENTTANMIFPELLPMDLPLPNYMELSANKNQGKTK